ncbi:MAG: hypothetical protein HFG20_05700 [Anaerotruncus sp.]|jgi:hypothetical protein|nr:hypothetical protein [Anaerotruncus sp.]
MVLVEKDRELSLCYTIGAFMKCKRALGTENLRKELLVAANRENYDVLVTALKSFSGGALEKESDAYAAIDRYMREHDCSAHEMFLEFICELDEAGFFRDRKSREELQQMAASPELEIDTDELLSLAMRSVKEKMTEGMLQELIDSATGASSSSESAPSPTSAG